MVAGYLLADHWFSGDPSPERSQQIGFVLETQPFKVSRLANGHIKQLGAP
jgi:hypothetical protein